MSSFRLCGQCLQQVNDVEPVFDVADFLLIELGLFRSRIFRRAGSNREQQPWPLFMHLPHFI